MSYKMEKDVLIQYYQQRKSTRDIAQLTGKSQKTVMYWTKKYEINIKDLRSKITTKTCITCLLEKPLEDFYKRASDRTDHNSICKSCNKLSVTAIRQNFKKLCVEYKGGCCSVCSYSKYLGALEFHHLDPAEKDFQISHRTSFKFDTAIKAELDKCILLCSNCHKEVHAGLVPSVGNDPT